MRAATPSAPIGIFDSGLGGLSVAREIRRLLPAEDLIYVADSAHVPYGGKTATFIQARSLALAEFLLEKGSKALVIACNTATAAAAALLRDTFPTVPILGMAPAVKPAAKATKTGVVGVLATTGTIQSASYAALLGKIVRETETERPVKFVNQAAPGLVECVESGTLDTPETRGKVAAFVLPLLQKGADVIVLGCTHYPFLRPAIQAVAGPDVQLIDTGLAVARHLRTRLEETGLLRPARSTPEPPGIEFLTSGQPSTMADALNRLWDGTFLTPPRSVGV